MDLLSLRELLEEALSDSMPNFEIYTAHSGEIVIATGLMEDDDGLLVEVEKDELINDVEASDLEPFEHEIPEDED
jgi:aspartokinase-like uncharacterized kinase